MSLKENTRSIAIKAVAKANNLELDLVNIELGNAPPAHLKANKLGKVPTFVGQDGFALSECIAIAIYSTSNASFCPSVNASFSPLLAPCV